MKKRQRFVALLLSFTILFCLASCKGNEVTKESESNFDEYEEINQSVTDSDNEKTEKSEKAEESETVEETEIVIPEITSDDITFYSIFNNMIYMHEDVDLSRWIQIDGYNLDGDPYIYYEGNINKIATYHKQLGSSDTREEVDSYSIIVYPCGYVVDMVNSAIKIDDFGPDTYINKDDAEEAELFETIHNGNLTEEKLIEIIKDDLYDETKANQPIMGYLERGTIVDDTTLDFQYEQPIYLESKEVHNNLIIINLSQNGTGYTLNGQFAATYAIDWSRSPEIELVDNKNFIVKYYIQQ